MHMLAMGAAMMQLRSIQDPSGGKSVGGFVVPPADSNPSGEMARER